MAELDPIATAMLERFGLHAYDSHTWVYVPLAIGVMSTRRCRRCEIIDRGDPELWATAPSYEFCSGAEDE